MDSFNYVMHEGQLCRTSQSYEPVDMGQLEQDVAVKEAAVKEKTDTLATLRSQMEAVELDVEEAESNFENSKSGLAVAKTLVGSPDDDAPEDGDGSPVADSTPEQQF